MDKSLNDYLDEIWKMVNELCYDINGLPISYLNNDVHNVLWSTYDLWFGYILNMKHGKCSLKSLIDFDPVKEVTNKHNEILNIYQNKNSLVVINC